MSHKEGYLFKRSKPQPFIGIIWQRRYFRMSDSQLLYFENAEKTKALGNILLKEIVNCRSADLDSGRANSLMVETMGRTYIFQADSARECSDWCSQITEKSKLAKGGSPSKPVATSSTETYTQDPGDKEGTLNKAAKRGPKSGWKPRWCFIHKDLLYYFENQMAKVSNMEPLGTIPLSSILFLEAAEEEETGRSLTFKLSTTHRTYYFQAETKEDMMNWVKAFKTKMGEKVRLESFMNQDRRKLRLESVGASLVEKAGILKKAGPDGGRTKVRYCVLKGETLSYYEKEDAPKPIGVILLSSCYEVKSAVGFSFEIQTEGRTYFFFADNIEERDGWVRAISSCMRPRSLRPLQVVDSSSTPIRKQGTLFKTDKSHTKWRRRHFVFQGDVLAYYDKAQDLTRPIGVIHLRECSTMKESEAENGRDYVWILISPNRVYKFSSETLGERESWIRTIHEEFPQIQVVRRSLDQYAEYLTRAHHADLEDFISFNIIRKTGTDLRGRQVYVFCPGRVPESADLNKLILLFIKVMDPFVCDPYVLVFVNSASPKQVKITWLKSCYEILPRSYKKNMQAFYILHPTKWYTVLQSSIRPLVSEKVWAKTQLIEKIADLYQFIKPDQLMIPQEAFIYEQEKNPQTKVFGVQLDELLMRVSFGQGSEDVPPIVEKCCNFLEKTALQAEGLFRLAGNASEVQEHKKMFDQGEDVCFTSSTDPHLVSSLLKLWIRELPEPLMTYDLYDQWVETPDSSGPELYLQDLKALFDLLPPPNKMVLKIAQYSSVNKMTPDNLSIVFAPNLLRDRGESIEQSLLDSPLVSKVVTTLISNAPRIFPC